MQLISIIIPVYKVEEYLAKCIESIISQTYKDIEIILVDDGSPDNCPVVCDEYAKKDSRIIVIHQKNSGVSSARNAGLMMAKGEYIGFVDGDDWIEPKMYEKMLENIISMNSQMCICTNYILNQKIISNSNLSCKCMNRIKSIENLFLSNFTTTLGTCLYSSKHIKGIYLNEAIYFWEDFEFQFRILSHLDKVSICHEAFYHYIQRENSANHQQMNDKKVTCLKISEPIKLYVQKNIPELYELSKELEIKFVKEILYSISGSRCLDKKYYILAKQISRKCLNDALKSNKTSKKNKISIILNAISPKLFYIYYKFARKIKHKIRTKIKLL